MSSSSGLLLFFLLHLLTTAGISTQPYLPKDQILLDCGWVSSTLDVWQRRWDGDAHSKYVLPTMKATSYAVEAAETGSGFGDSLPHTTARVSQSQFTYSFRVSAGPKFIRLYFYSAAYSGLNKTEFFFSVTANEFTLLSNFSAYLTSIAPVGNTGRSTGPTVIKEFIVNVEEKQSLNVTFSPSPKSSAFINGIEIYSMPDTLYFPGNNKPIKFMDQFFYLQTTTALETLYRLKVGSNPVLIGSDTGMFRLWSPDSEYIFGGDYGYSSRAANIPINYSLIPAYTAPKIVYNTSRVIANESKSLEWSFPVDSGFYCLLRLHFCEMEVIEPSQRVFAISINNQTVETEADVISWTSGRGIPIFRDYVTHVSDDDLRGKKNLRLSLFRTNLQLPKYTNALLNGIEIFKLSNSNRSLARGDPDVGHPGLESGLALKKKKKSKGSSLLYPVIGSVIGVLAVLLLVTFLIFRCQRDANYKWIKSGRSGQSPLSELCRSFLFEEIKSATGNFNESFVIGMGGFGKVYKGYIDKGENAVAIKRLNPLSNQGVHEFETEIRMLSTLRHRHLVSLIGYCDQRGEMILVYDYMVHGTLRDHLYHSKNAPLPWNSRLQIVIGAAKGLEYLHTGAKHVVIHRDVKSTNILLDGKWVAKVSDFGLSKIGPTDGMSDTHVSTIVKGTFGYLDPEYYMRQQLRDKSDVYSFGVVMFEVLCARPPIIQNIPETQVNLAEWAKICHRNGTLEQIVDPNLEGQIAPECLSKYVEIATKCLRYNGIYRPTISDVVSSLESAMQLQVAADSRCSAESAVNSDSLPMHLLYPTLQPGEPIISDEIFSSSGKFEAKLASAANSDISSSSISASMS